MKYTNMKVANHTLTHHLGKVNGKTEAFRDLSPEEQRIQFGLNQVMLAKVIQDSGVDPSEILTNYARISNEPTSDPAKLRETYKRLNKLGLRPVQGLNHEVGTFSDYYNESAEGIAWDRKSVKDKEKWARANADKMVSLMRNCNGIPVFYLHLHNEQGKYIIRELIKKGYGIQSLPWNTNQ